MPLQIIMKRSGKLIQWNHRMARRCLGTSFFTCAFSWMRGARPRFQLSIDSACLEGLERPGDLLSRFGVTEEEPLRFVASMRAQNVPLMGLFHSLGHHAKTEASADSDHEADKCGGVAPHREIPHE